MKSIYCPTCGFKFNGETKCPNCGYIAPTTINHNQYSINNKENNMIKTPTHSTHIIHITDKSKCKKIFEYFKLESLKYIENYLSKKDENEYANQINAAVQSPLEFYSADITFPMNNIRYTFYSHVNNNFYNTSAFNKMCNGKKDAEIMEIEVYYRLEQIYYNGKNLRILAEPEVGVLPSSYESMEILHETDDWNIKSGYRAPVNAESFYLYIST